MDVSEGDSVSLIPVEDEPGGQELIRKVVSLTGLPGDLIRGELDHILDTSGQNSQSLTLEQLRGALAAYLEALHEDLFDPNS